jgi:hypothetical protein
MMPTFIFSRGGERLHEFAGADGNQLTSTVASLIEYHLQNIRMLMTTLGWLRFTYVLDDTDADT